MVLIHTSIEYCHNDAAAVIRHASKTPCPDLIRLHQRNAFSEHRLLQFVFKNLGHQTR